MTTMTPQAWETLRDLASRVGFSVERVSALQRRLEDTRPRPGSPYILLAGRPEAGIELTLARWLAPDIAEELQQAGECPLVIGRTPDQVRPALGTWPTWSRSQFGPGHLIALRIAGKLSPATLAQVASLGFLEQAVVVTRLSQPLHLQEREIAHALVPLVATVRVLVVALPGEAPSAPQIAEVTAFAVRQMQHVGFDGGRCLGAAVWFTSGDRPAGTLQALEPFFAAEPTAVAAGCGGMERHALADLFKELQRLAANTPMSPHAALSEDECDHLSRELASYLADLGHTLQKRVEHQQAMTTAALCTSALNALRGWGAYASVEGHWLKYVERLRPGTQEAFLAEAEAAVSNLDYEPGTSVTEHPNEAHDSWLTERVIVEGKRLGLGLLSGLAAYWLVGAFLRSHAVSSDTLQAGSGLSTFLTTLISYMALGLGTVLGYGGGRRLFSAPLPRQRAPSTSSTQPSMHGWPQIEHYLTAWFRHHMGTRPASPSEELHVLAQRFEIEEIDQ
jgi:hypothetical protein